LRQPVSQPVCDRANQTNQFEVKVFGVRPPLLLLALPPLPLLLPLLLKLRYSRAGTFLCGCSTGGKTGQTAYIASGRTHRHCLLAAVSAAAAAAVMLTITI